MKVIFGHIIGATSEEYQIMATTLGQIFSNHPVLKDVTLVFTPKELKFYDKDEIIKALNNGEDSSGQKSKG